MILVVVIMEQRNKSLSKNREEFRYIGGSKVLLVRKYPNFLTSQSIATQTDTDVEVCLIEKTIEKHLEPQEPKEPIEPIEPKEPPREQPKEPIANQVPQTSKSNIKVGLTLTAAVAAVGLWWYTKSD